MVEKNRDIFWIFVFLIALISVLLVMWGLGGGYMSGMMGMMGYGWGSMILIPTAFLVLIAIGAYYLITGFNERDRSTSHGGRRAPWNSCPTLDGEKKSSNGFQRKEEF